MDNHKYKYVIVEVANFFATTIVSGLHIVTGYIEIDDDQHHQH